MFDADFIWCLFVGHIVLIFVLCFGVCWFSYSFGKWVWCFSGFYSICEYESLIMSVVLDYLSCITMFLCWHNMCVLLSWVYYFKTFNFQFVMSHYHLLYFGCMWFSLCILDSWLIVLLTVIYKFVLLYALLHFHHFDAPTSFYIDMTYVWNCVWFLWFTFISESNQVDIYPLWCCFWFFAVYLLSCRCLVDPLKAKML